MLYVGGISDVELTRVIGLLNKLADKPGVSVMADQGRINLNLSIYIPPFMEGRKQLPAEEVKSGRRIASLRIHGAIGRKKISLF